MAPTDLHFLSHRLRNKRNQLTLLADALCVTTDANEQGEFLDLMIVTIDELVAALDAYEQALDQQPPPPASGSTPA